MRRYNAGARSLATDGTLTLKGRGLTLVGYFLALAPMVAIAAGMRSLLPLQLSLGAACVLLLWPPRRTIVFDASLRELRIRHSGALAERSSKSIPFAQLKDVRIVDRPRGTIATSEQALHAVCADGSELYLTDFSDVSANGNLQAEVRAMLNSEVARTSI